MSKDLNSYAQSQLRDIMDSNIVSHSEEILTKVNKTVDKADRAINIFKIIGLLLIVLIVITIIMYIMMRKMIRERC